MEYKKLKKMYQSFAGFRSKMPKKGEAWCVHCKVSDHSLPDYVKHDYCERLGHEWEDCEIKRSTPIVRLAALVTQDNSRPPKTY